MVMSSRRRAQIERREQDILAGAMALFNRDDWPSVTMDQIASAADVSKGTLYNHFSSKDDVYARLLIDFSSAVIARLEGLVLATSPAARIRELLAVLWDAYRENPSYRRIAYYCEREGFRRALSEPLRDELSRLDDRFLALSAAALRQGIATGQFRAAPIVELQLALRFVLAGMSRVVWSSEVAAAKDDTSFVSLCEFVLAGLGAADV